MSCPSQGPDRSRRCDALQPQVGTSTHATYNYVFAVFYREGTAVLPLAGGSHPVHHPCATRLPPPRTGSPSERLTVAMRAPRPTSTQVVGLGAWGAGDIGKRPSAEPNEQCTARWCTDQQLHVPSCAREPLPVRTHNVMTLHPAHNYFNRLAPAADS